MPLWSHAEKQASICQRAVRQHRRSDNSSYSSVGRFSHQLHGTTTTLPADKNAKAFHRQNLRAFTRSDYNARLGGSFSRQHPASSRDQNDSDTNHHPYPAATSGGARPDSHPRFYFPYFQFRNGRKAGSKPPSPHRKTGSIIQNANLMHLPPPILQLLDISHPANQPF